MPVAIAILLGTRLLSLTNILGRICDWGIYFYKEQSRDVNHPSTSTSRGKAVVRGEAERSDKDKASRVSAWVRNTGGPSQAANTEGTTDRLPPPFSTEDVLKTSFVPNTQTETDLGANLDSDERTPLLGNEQQVDSPSADHTNGPVPRLDVEGNAQAYAPPNVPDPPISEAQAALPTNNPMGPGLHGQNNDPADGLPRHSSHRRPRTGTSERENYSEDDKPLSRGWLYDLFSGFLSVAFGSWVIAASFSATTRADSSGLSASKYCGSWSLKRNPGKQAMDNDDLLQAQKERRAGQYGRNCYGQRWVTSPDQCKLFDSQTIGYDVSFDWECPFQNKNFCHGGKFSAVRFSTGLKDASVLGINTAKPPKFNRTTVCVPLDLDQGFVREIPPDVHHHDYRYEYDLGPLNGSEHSSNYTYRTLGNPFKWDVPAYSMR